MESLDRRRFLQGSALTVAGIGIGASVLAACGDDDDDSAGPAEEGGGTTTASAELLTVRTPGFYVASLVHAMMAVTLREENDKRRGLEWDVEWTSALEDLITALVNNRADFTPNLLIDQWARFIQDGQRVRIVGSTLRPEGVLIGRAGETFEDWGAIKGKRVATSEASYIFGWMQALSKDAGFELQDEVEIVNVPFASAATEIQAGNVDYAIVFEPDGSYFASLNEEDFQIAFNPHAAFEDMVGIGRFPVMTLTTSEELLAEHEDAPKGLLDTLYDFQQVWNNDHDAMAELLAEPEDPANRQDGGRGLELEHITRALNLEVSDAPFGTSMIVEDFRPHVDGYMKVLEQLKSVGFLPEHPSEEELFWFDGPEYETPS